jgi:hypothetical protein
MSASAGKSAASPRGSIRTCVRCRKSESPDGMVRWVRGPDGGVVPDLAGKKFGRGAWSHATPDCLKGLSRALAKSFREEISANDEDLAQLLATAALHRVWLLLGAARRSGRLVFGGTPVAEAVAGGGAELLLVARDAQSAAKQSSVGEMVRLGRARVWGTKDELGKLCGRPEIAVLAVLDLRLAQGLFGAIAMAPQGSGPADPPPPDPLGS